MNAVGLVAFATVGSLKAVDAEFDVLGVAVLGVLTALGGGATRDVLVGRMPAMLQSTTDVGFALGGVLLAVVLARRLGTGLLDHPAVVVPDAVGLAAFAATGALVGVEAGASPFGVVVLGTITGVGGGLVSDVLLQRVPFVLAEDFYATCAVTGSAALWAVTAAGGSPTAGTAACAGLTFALRLLAIRFDWRLPTVRLSAAT
ncbi:trimeric intracellular cation channel family protein [Halobacterium rubrum]|uniref:trimeric intracellular cation channel family protein n=1 Tax=Halobacterium TaxID=2239 RepID=UPI001F3EFA32|nr:MULTISPECIES: trimeric intracellular cation channel family protein [Halobacterium]MDH5021649.1 trimeric intracellular cation channel family protein [Halobacterium rubrum]